jgi:hypothetical protein
VNVGEGAQVETESMAIDGDGRVPFKTRDLTDDGAIRWQHREAVLRRSGIRTAERRSALGEVTLRRQPPVRRVTPE